MDIQGLDFVRGVEMADGSFVLAAQDPSVSLRSNPHTGLAIWTKDQGWEELGMEPQITTDMTTAKGGTVAVLMDPFGNVLEFDGDYLDESKITGDGDQAPKYEMRCIRGIGQSVHAGGVARQGYRMVASGAWESTTPGSMHKFDDPTAFAGIDGFSETEVYAAGWEGEIWSFDGTDWTQQHSPTNLILNDICVGPDRCVAVGLMGQVIVGRGSEWRAIEHSITEEPIWSVRAFDGAYYMSTIDGILKLDGDELSVFQTHDEKVRTTYGLAVGPSGLWSIGAADVTLFDGTDWHSIGQS